MNEKRISPIAFRNVELEKALRKRTQEENTSLLASRLLREYVFVLDSAELQLRKKFSVAELKALYDVGNGWAHDSESPEIVAQGVLWMEVQDAEGIEEKWEIERKQLVSALQELSSLEHFTLIDMIRKFWAAQ